MTQVSPPVLPPRQEFTIPLLGEVKIVATDSRNPRLSITFSPDYKGELRHDVGDDGVLYLECDSSECITGEDVRRKLNAFVEVLYHHDYDRDGKFDADDVINAIELAMWRSDELPIVFERPQNGIYTRMLMKLLSVAPPPVRHIAYSFGELRPRFHKIDYIWAIALIGVFIGLVQLQLHLAPWMHYSVISGYVAAAEWAGLPSWAIFALIGVFIGFSARRGGKKKGRTQSPHTYGLFNQAALYEEQVWREGSHRWGFGQRLVSCFTFGAIHMVNLIYPLASILPLTVAGGVFMFIYLRTYKQYRLQGRVHARRDATLRAAVAHRLYNRCALALMAVFIIVLITDGTMNLFAAFAVLGTVVTLFIRDKHTSR